MPLPNEKPGPSVANIIGRFEQQTKKQSSSSPGPRTSSVVSHITGDSVKEEIKERREWPPRTSNVNSPPNDSKVGGREWPPRPSSQGSGITLGQRWPPLQPIIQASPFSELKKTPTPPLAKGSELGTPPEVDEVPPPPTEPPKVIEVTPPSRKPTLVEPEPLKPVEPEPIETPKIPQPTATSPATKPGPSSVVTRSPPKTIKTTPTKSATKTPSKPPPSSFAKGTSLHADPNDRRTSTSARPPSRPTSRANLRSKTPTSSTPVRPKSSAQKRPPTETPKHTPTSVKRSETSISSHQSPGTPSKPPPVIPETQNSRLFAPTAASLAKSRNSPQTPPPERKKTLSSGASLERLSKPTASSLSKSKSAHSITSTTSPPKSKPAPTRTRTLTTGKKTTTASKSGGKTKAPGPTTGKDSARKDGDVHQGHHENGNGVGAAEEILHPEIQQLNEESYAHESDREDEYMGNGSFEVSYVEEPLDTRDDASVHDHKEIIHCPVHQEHAETPRDLVRSRSPEFIEPALVLHAEDDVAPGPPHEVSADAVEDEEPKQEEVKDDIADIVGLLETTSFTSKHILQGSDESVVNDPHTPGSDKERQRIGEIPDEE